MIMIKTCMFCGKTYFTSVYDKQKEYVCPVCASRYRQEIFTIKNSRQHCNADSYKKVDK